MATITIGKDFDAFWSDGWTVRDEIDPDPEIGFTDDSGSVAWCEGTARRIATKGDVTLTFYGWYTYLDDDLGTFQTDDSYDGPDEFYYSVTGLTVIEAETGETVDILDYSEHIPDFFTAIDYGPITSKLVTYDDEGEDEDEIWTCDNCGNSDQDGSDKCPDCGHAMG